MGFNISVSDKKECLFYDLILYQVIDGFIKHAQWGKVDLAVNNLRPTNP